MNNLRFMIHDSRFKGFTLIELLVVMAILAIFGTLILTIFTNTLKGSNKSQFIGIIKQNGQAVLEAIDKTVRNADDIVCFDNISFKTLVVVKNGIYTRYRIKDPSPAISPTANGYIQQDAPYKTTVEGSSPPRQETDVEFVSRVCNENSVNVEPVIILTDTNPQSGVSVVNGTFKKEKTSGFMDQVTINFDLKPGVSASASVTGQIDTANFQTTIQLR